MQFTRFATKPRFGLPGLTLFIAGLLSLSSCSTHELPPQPDVVPQHQELPTVQTDDDDDNTDKPPKNGHGG